MRPRLTVPALAVALATAGAAPAHAEIVPQESIAGVELQMSKSEVRTVLGQPARKRRFAGGPSGEDHFAEWTYVKRALSVRFLLRRSYRVASITVTRGSGERTASGVGIGSTRAEVKAGLPGIFCKRYDPTYAVCFLGEGRIGDITTSFGLDRRDRVKEITLAKILYH